MATLAGWIVPSERGWRAVVIAASERYTRGAIDPLCCPGVAHTRAGAMVVAKMCNAPWEIKRVELGCLRG
jgi:hypothetical protein